MGRWKHNWFLISSILLVVFAVVILLIFPRDVIHIRINSWHMPMLDKVFRTWTLLGDGLVVLVVVFIPLFVQVRYSLVLLAGYAISGLFAQLIKHLFFTDTPRPAKYFEMNGIEYDLYLVPGVELHNWNSFPSGHTATAFAVFFGLSLILKSRGGQLAAFLVALGVAYSRIYLSQHFLTDVTAGAVLGLIGGYSGWLWVGRYDREWLNKPVQKLFTGERYV